MKKIALALLLAAFAAPAAAQQAQHAQRAPAAPAATPSAAKDLADGEVRKVDKSAGRIVLKHGEIRNIDMGPMTMVFAVKPPSLLDKVEAGDKVKFRAEVVNGDYVVTAIEKVK